MQPTLQSSREFSAGVLSAIHVAFFLARLLVLVLLSATFLHAAFTVLAVNSHYDSWMASALYIAIAAAVIAACVLIVFVLLLRSVFTVSSIVDIAHGTAGDAHLPRQGSLLLPLRSARALRPSASIAQSCGLSLSCKTPNFTTYFCACLAPEFAAAASFFVLQAYHP